MDNETQKHITVEYERTIDDIIEFNLFHMSHSPSIRRQTLIGQISSAVLAFIVGFAIAYITPLEERVLKYILYFVVLAVSIGSFYLFPHLQRRDVIKGYRKASKEGKNDALLGHQTISLTPENILTKSQRGESKLIWSSIDRIAQNDKYIFLYTSSISAITIPKNAFSADNSLPKFLNYINAHLETKN